MKAGVEAAERLLRLRVAVRGEGSATAADWGFEAVLPGSRAVVRLRREGDREIGQIFWPGGERRMSVPLVITEPSKFASLMHNCDCEMQLIRGTSAEELRMLDAAAASDDESIARSVDEAIGSGRPRSGEAVFRSVARAMAESGDSVLDGISRAATAARASGERGFDEIRSLVRWNLIVDSWTSPDDGLPREAPHGECCWRRLNSFAGVTAAARSLGRIEGDLARWPMDPESSRRRTAEAVRRVMSDGPDPESRWLEADSYYVLEDAVGAPVMAAAFKGSDVRILLPPDREEDDFDVDAVVALKEAVLGTDAPRGP